MDEDDHAALDAGVAREGVGVRQIERTVAHFGETARSGDTAGKNRGLVIRSDTDGVGPERDGIIPGEAADRVSVRSGDGEGNRVSRRGGERAVLQGIDMTESERAVVGKSRPGEGVRPVEGEGAGVGNGQVSGTGDDVRHGQGRAAVDRDRPAGRREGDAAIGVINAEAGSDVESAAGEGELVGGGTGRIRPEILLARNTKGAAADGGASGVGVRPCEDEDAGARGGDLDDTRSIIGDGGIDREQIGGVIVCQVNRAGRIGDASGRENAVICRRPDGEGPRVARDHDPARRAESQDVGGPGIVGGSAAGGTLQQGVDVGGARGGGSDAAARASVNEADVAIGSGNDRAAEPVHVGISGKSLNVAPDGIGAVDRPVVPHARPAPENTGRVI